MLHFPILVNNKQIGYVYIRRLKKAIGDINEYEYEVTYPGRDKVFGLVRHRYSNGALALIQIVMQDALDMKAIGDSGCDGPTECSGCNDCNCWGCEPTEKELRELANKHRDDVVEGSGVAIESKDFRKSSGGAPESNRNL